MESIINKMEAINPKDLSRLDPDTISYVTLKNGNIIVLDTSVKEKKNENDKIKSLNYIFYFLLFITFRIQ